MSQEVAGSPQRRYCVTAVSIRSLEDGVTEYRLTLGRWADQLRGVHREVSPLNGHSGAWTIEARKINAPFLSPASCLHSQFGFLSLPTPSTEPMLIRRFLLNHPSSVPCVHSLAPCCYRLPPLVLLNAAFAALTSSPALQALPDCALFGLTWLVLQYSPQSISFFPFVLQNAIQILFSDSTPPLLFFTKTHSSFALEACMLFLRAVISLLL